MAASRGAQLSGESRLERAGIANLVADVGFSFFDGGSNFLGGLIEGQPDDFTGVGIELPEADELAAVGDGVAGEVGDAADVGVEVVGVVEQREVVAAVMDQAVDAGQ